MAIETQYNIVKVNELRQITEAQGKDEIIINDIDSFPLETKKITAEDFAISIKDYILPIASETVLGGVKIGEGLTINPVTGVLTNAVLLLTDLQDVFVVNPEEGQVLRYKGNLWINEAEGGITNVIAGEGLWGGGFEGDVTLNVNAGPGLSIQNDSVAINPGDGLEVEEDVLNVRINPGLTFSSNAITIVPGVGLNIQGDAVNFVPALGLTQQGSGIRVDNGKGLYFSGNKLELNINENLAFDDQDRLSIEIATYTKRGISKFAPLVDRIEDVRGTPSYEGDQINPAFVDKIPFVPTGAVFWFATSDAPNGFLFCDGSVVSRTTYSFLFQAIGTTFNTGGEPSTSFRLPDLRNDFIRGADSTTGNGRAVGYREGEQTQVAPHQHDIDQVPYTLSGGGGGNAQVHIPWGAGFTGNYWDPPTVKGVYPARPVIGNMSYDIDGGFEGVTLNGRLATETDIFQDDKETRPRNVALLPCIKT